MTMTNPTSQPRIDRDFLAEIVESFGPEVMVELCDSLRAEAAEDFAGLDEAIAAANAPAARGRLHALRGGALNLGLVAFAADAGRLEKAAAAGEVPHPEARRALAGLFAASMDELDALSAKLAA